MPGYEANGTRARPLVDHRARLDSGLPYSEVERDGLRSIYREEVAYTDRLVGRVLEAVHSRGIAEKMLIIIAADHGEMLGEDGVDFAHYGLHESVVRVPLMAHFPGAPPKRFGGQVRLMDIGATLFAYGGVPVECEGTDLQTLVSEPTPRSLPALLLGRRGRDFSGGALLAWRTPDTKVVRDLVSGEEKRLVLGNPATADGPDAADQLDAATPLFRALLDGRTAESLSAPERNMLEALGYVE